MNEELKKLIEGNYRVVTEMFVFGDLPFDESRERDRLCPVVSEEFKTLAQLRSYLETIYTEEEADRILREGADLGGPLYIEKEGTLFIDLDFVTGGAPEAWMEWTVEPETFPDDEDKTDITVHAVFDAFDVEDEEVREERKVTYQLQAVRTPKGWRLAEMVDTPEEWLSLVPEEEE